MTLRDYLYIDESKLNLLAQQIRTTKKETVKRGKKISLSITGLGVELSEEDAWREFSTHEKIDTLIAHLTISDLLDTTRPQERDPREDAGIPCGRPFVLETALARRVIIPDAQLGAAPGIKHLAVWVSDPDPNVYTRENWVWRGAFLYLTELWLDDRTSPFWSGCSALQAIVNAARGDSLNTLSASELFGRRNCDHPVSKLLSIGAIAGDLRRITSLYAKRSITNEQCYTWEGEQRRVNDLLGYPVFIATATR